LASLVTFDDIANFRNTQRLQVNLFIVDGRLDERHHQFQVATVSDDNSDTRFVGKTSIGMLRLLDQAIYKSKGRLALVAVALFVLIAGLLASRVQTTPASSGPLATDSPVLQQTIPVQPAKVEPPPAPAPEPTPMPEGEIQFHGFLPWPE
jgi:hypothetical protein